MNDGHSPHDSAAKHNIAGKFINFIKGLCVGNGFRQEDITPISHHAMMLEMDAVTYFAPTVTQKDKSLPGKQNGHKIFQSSDESAQAIALFQDQIKQSRDIPKSITPILQKQKDKGLGQQGKSLRLKSLDRRYVTHIACEPCHGGKQVTCSACNGRKQVRCDKCGGKGHVRCIVCQGRRNVPGPDGRSAPCPRCRGRGELTCDPCRGSGQSGCGVCRSQGYVACPACKGEGAQSIISDLHVNVRIYNQFHLRNWPDNTDDQNGLTPQGMDLLMDKAPELNRRAIAKIIKTAPGHTEKGDPCLIHRMTIPYAELVMKMGENKAELILAGHRPQFLKAPPLLEAKIAFPLQEISNPDNLSRPIRTLKEIGKIKIFREAMVLTARSSVNAAAKSLFHKYDSLIREDSAQNIALRMNMVLDRAVQRPRRMAGLVVMLCFIVLYGGYFLGGGQHHIIKMASGIHEIAWVTPYFDWLVLSIMLLLSGPLFHFFSDIIFKKRLAKLLPRQYATLLLMKLKRFDITPYMICGALFAAYYLLGLNPDLLHLIDK